MCAELNIPSTTHKIFKNYTLFLKIIPNYVIFFIGRIYNRELRFSRIWSTYWLFGYILFGWWYR